MYSEQELKLITFFGYEYAINDWSVSEMYNQMAFQAFVNDMKGKEIESLRRCCKAFYPETFIPRKTKEFDDLIEF